MTDDFVIILNKPLSLINVGREFNITSDHQRQKFQKQITAEKS